MKEDQRPRLDRTTVFALVLAAVLAAALGIHLWNQHQEQQRRTDQLTCGLKQLGDAYNYGSYDSEECDD